jgi:hypothetical protein
MSKYELFVFLFFWCCFMGSNNSRKQVSLKKIVTSPRVSVSSQYKKDNRCLPARTQLPTIAMRVH